MKKRILSTILALALCLTLLPTAVFAEEGSSTSGRTALTADVLGTSYTLSDGTYYLSDDLELNHTLSITGTVTLDLNGHVLMLQSSTYGGNAIGSVIEVADGGHLTLNDSSSTSEHYFYTETGSVLWHWEKEAVAQPEDGEGKAYATVRGGVITGGRTSYGGGIHVLGGASDSDSTLTMNGGNIIGCTSVNGGGVYVGTSASTSKKGTFAMNGGSIVGCAASMQGSGVFVNGGSSFTLKSGIIQACITKQYDDGANCLGAGVYNAGTFTMKGGEIKDCKILPDSTKWLKQAAGGGIYDCGTFSLSGGEITDCSASDDGSGDGIFLENGKTFADVLPDGYALQSGSTVVAFNQSSCGNVKIVKHDHNYNIFEPDDSQYYCTCGQSSGVRSVLYLDENGVEKYCHQYATLVDYDGATELADGWYVAPAGTTSISALSLIGDVHLILCDGAALNVKQITSSSGKNLTIYAQSTGSSTGKLTCVSSLTTSAISMDGGGTLTVNGGDVSATGDSFGIYISKSYLTVHGGTITALGGESGIYASYSSTNSGTGKITVTGGTVTATGGTDPADPNGRYGISCVQFEMSGGTVTATGNAAASASFDSCGLYARDGMRVTGGTIEATGKEAGGLSCGIKVADDVSISGNPTITAKSVTAENSTTKASHGFYCSGDLTVSGGTITAKSDVVNGTDTFVYSEGLSCYGALTVSGGTIEATGSTAKVNVTATGTSSGAYSYGMWVLGNAAMTGGSIVAKGSTASYEGAAPLSTVSAGFYCSALTISDGSIDATGDAAYFGSFGINAASITANGGTLTGKTETTNATDDAAICAYSDFTFGTGMGITQPIGGTVGSAEIEGWNMSKYFVAEGNTPAKLAEIGEKNSASSGSGSSSGGGSSSSNTTVKNPDGSTTTTTTDKNGSVTETVKNPNGVTGTTVTDKDGTVTNISASIPASAAKNGDPVTLPIDEVTATDSENAAEITVDVPKGGAAVEIPVKNPTPGTVIVIVNQDGTETVLPASKVTENGVTVTLSEGATIKVIDNSKNFSDVKDSDYFSKAVKWASARNITGGTSATTFGPHDSCTRAQLVTFLYRYVQAQGGGFTGAWMFQLPFTDVSEWCYEAVAWSYMNGIVGGYGNGLFGSGDTVTREQMAVILYRFAQAMGMDTTQGGMAVREYADYARISDYAVAAMQWAVNAGILQGSDGSLMPQQPCTRAQIVTMLYRLLGK